MDSITSLERNVDEMVSSIQHPACGLLQDELHLLVGRVRSSRACLSHHVVSKVL